MFHVFFGDDHQFDDTGLTVGSQRILFAASHLCRLDYPISLEEHQVRVISSVLAWGDWPSLVTEATRELLSFFC